MRLIRVAITITGAGAGNIAALLCAGLFFLFVPPVMANTADAVRGQKIFKVCASCHQVGPKAKNSVGPHLNRIFGRRAGSVEGASYSTDLTRAGQTGLHWDLEHLNIYLENPRNLVSGTLMKFRGLKDPNDRADVIAYLRTFSDNPRDIPEAAPTATTTPHDPAVDPGILAIQGDPEFGEYLAGECVTCHQRSGDDQGIPSIVGWPVEVFVTAMHAYRAKSRTHPVMQMIAGPLNDDEIASLAVYFEKLSK